MTIHQAHSTGFWVPEKHIQRTKLLQAKCLSPLCPAAYSPHHHRLWCSFDLKQVRMAFVYLVERYYTFGTTSLACGCRKKHIQRTNSSTDPAPLNLGLAACLPPFHPPIVLNRRGTSSRGSPSLQTTCFERILLTFSESTMLLVVHRVCDRCASPLKEMAPRVILEILSARRVTPGRPRRR